MGVFETLEGLLNSENQTGTVKCEKDINYVSISEDYACLDGDFTAEELELVMTELKKQKTLPKNVKG